MRKVSLTPSRKPSQRQPYLCQGFVIATPVAAPSSTKQKDSISEILDSEPSTSIAFNIHYATAFGEMVKIVGKGPELGDWNVDQAVALKWTEGDLWRAKLPLTSTSYEYKFVVVNTTTKHIQWEDGPNRHLDLSDCPPELSLEWNSLAGSSQRKEQEPEISSEELAARERERSEASTLIFQAFSRRVSQAAPGSVWATAPHWQVERNAEAAAAIAAAGAELAARVLQMHMSKAAQVRAKEPALVGAGSA